MIIGRCNISLGVISNFKIGFLEIHRLPNLIASLLTKYFWLKCHLILSFKYVVFWFASFANSEITFSWNFRHLLPLYSLLFLNSIIRRRVMSFTNHLLTDWNFRNAYFITNSKMCCFYNLLLLQPLGLGYVNPLYVLGLGSSDSPGSRPMPCRFVILQHISD